MNLLQKLAEVYPDWRQYHRTAIEAAVEVGLLDEADLDEADVPALNFNED